MKVLTIIDSFKGTLSSKQLGYITKDELEKKGHHVDSICISDGGEGFLDAIYQNSKYTKKCIIVNNPLFELIPSYYLVCEETKTAFIELALSSGITLIHKSKLNPFITSTYGLGETIKDAINSGYKNIIIGIGGSCTNDGGAGMLEALGCEFRNVNAPLFHMCNDKLKDITNINTNKLDELINDVNFQVLSDVQNPLLGPNGATYIYSPQKGAKDIDLPVLEENMRKYSEFNSLYKDNPGSGAAGGVGYALKTYLHANVVSGIDYLLNSTNYSTLSQKYDYIITGEGKLDYQSFQGKVISSIIKKTIKAKIIIVCGINECPQEYSNNNLLVYSIVNDTVSKDMSMSDPEYYFRKMIKEIKEF